ncbi:MAG TPA: ABC transporter permease [Dinghuibacter sp.]|uniref:ABC transporter permease n=1 Tax=Dinghuibacter sp. TaxID=2024697 RepID=UPI002C3B2DE1|nr:ABC transporter permease [Dinghuibacter sp.]HTJ12701.1 ABC transporter permease [Dinghuibacter sp.]
MLRNYLRIALRQLKKQKLYSTVKIGGLALGIAVCLLIGLYIRYETGYDRQYPDGNRIFRVFLEDDENGQVQKSTNCPAPMAAVIKSDFPQVARSGRWLDNALFDGAGHNEFRPAEATENTYEEGFVYADQETLDMLGFPMVYGSRATALTEPRSMVISRRKAEQFFPGINPIGQVVYLNDQRQTPYKISGVMADIPQDSHLRNTDFIMSLQGHSLWDGEQTSWNAFNYTGYVQLKRDVDPVAFSDLMTTDLVNRYFIPVAIKSGQPEASARKFLAGVHVRLQPVRDINLHSYDIEDRQAHGDIRFVWLFGLVAAFILAIACINFINLSTARSANRAKEVGLRKVVGSARGGLVAQFLTESVLYSLLSFLAGLVLAQVLLPYFNTMAGRELVIPWTAWWLAPVMALAALAIGVIAGVYPAFYLSAFRPALVLKGTLSQGARNSLLRNILVVFQFAASVILVISTIVIYKQMRFLLNRDAGFDKDQVVMIQGVNTLPEDKIRAFKTELSKLPSVKSVTISDFLPVDGTKRNGQTFYNEGHKDDPTFESQVFHVDEDYIKTLGMTLVAGRNFSKAMATDDHAVVINETMARQLGLTSPVGHRIVQFEGDTYTIIGVVRDFNYSSMHSGIGPLVMRLDFSPSIVSAKIDGAHAKRALDALTALWKGFSPGQPIRYTFLDEQFAAMYADVLRSGQLFTAFATLAVIIACLGLFGLSAFMAEQRRKEIGIRKVLGATVTSITVLLSYDFVKLVLLSVVIAAPLGWWGMHRWLENFAYRTGLDWWIFGIAGVFALLVALCTVSVQSVKAALANPASTLKSQ